MNWGYKFGTMNSVILKSRHGSSELCKGVKNLKKQCVSLEQNVILIKYESIKPGFLKSLKFGVS